ncbi:hypothetical protein MMPV_005857 [Pyropia vietnamensis]
MSEHADQLTRPSGRFAPVQRHGPLELLFGGTPVGEAAKPSPAVADATSEVPAPDGLWVVHGMFSMAPLGIFTIPRTMVVIRHSGGRLCLIHTMRLDEAGEAALRALGTVDSVVRLGSFHGVDDDYYVRTFGATSYVLPGCPLPSGSPWTPIWMEPSTAAADGAPPPPALPIPGAQLFRFDVAKAEGAVYLPQFGPPDKGGGGGGGGGGTLVVCDAVMNVPPRATYLGWLSATAFRLMGWTGLRPAPLWYRGMKRLGGLDDAAMAAEYRRLLDAYPFETLVCVHGDVIASGAHGRVAAMVAGLVPAA